jgi:hypothetical protein
MEVATGKHGSPLIPTLFHFFPHAAKISPFLGYCQEKKAQGNQKISLASGVIPGKG